MEYKEIIDQINELSNYEVNQRHTYFQLKYFLIGKEPTNQSKMWQCLRELKTRRDSISSIDLELEETKDKIEILKIELENIIIENEKILEIETRQRKRKIRALEQNIIQLEERKKGILEECFFFSETFKNIQKTEKLKNFDDLEVQKEYWNAKLSQKINLKLISGGQIDSELIDTVMALPEEVPIKQQIISVLEKKKEEFKTKIGLKNEENK